MINKLKRSDITSEKELNIIEKEISNQLKDHFFDKSVEQLKKLNSVLPDEELSELINLQIDLPKTREKQLILLKRKFIYKTNNQLKEIQRILIDGMIENSTNLMEILLKITIKDLIKLLNLPATYNNKQLEKLTIEFTHKSIDELSNIKNNHVNIVIKQLKNFEKKYKHLQPDEHLIYNWSSLEYPNMDMEDLPVKRAYKSIREFQPYELTQCITYELAIRDPKYIKKVDITLEAYHKDKEFIDFYIENQNIKKLNQKLNDRLYQIENKTYTIKEFHSKGTARYGKILLLIKKIETIPFHSTDSFIERKEINIYGEEIYSLLDKIMKYSYNGKRKRIMGLIEHGSKSPYKYKEKSTYDILRNFYSNKINDNPTIMVNEEKVEW